MSQIIINNGDSGLVVRNALNQMFTELYGAIVSPVKLPGVNSNTTQVISSDTFVEAIYLTATSGTPTVRIGTTPNGQEICPDVQPGSFQTVFVQQYFAVSTTLYITLSGGTINVRFDLTNNFF